MPFYERYLNLLNEARILTWGTHFFENYRYIKSPLENITHLENQQPLDFSNIKKWKQNFYVHEGTAELLAKSFKIDPIVLYDKVEKWNGKKRFFPKQIARRFIDQDYRALFGGDFLHSQIIANKVIKSKSNQDGYGGELSSSRLLELRKKHNEYNRDKNRNTAPFNLKAVVASALLDERDRYDQYISQLEAIKKIFGVTDEEVDLFLNSGIEEIKSKIFNRSHMILVKNEDNTVCLKDVNNTPIELSYLYEDKNMRIRLLQEKNRYDLIVKLFKKIKHPQAEAWSEELMDLFRNSIFDTRDFVQFVDSCDDDFIELVYSVFHLLYCNQYFYDEYQSINQELRESRQKEQKKILLEKIKFGPFGYTLRLIKAKTGVEDKELEQILGVSDQALKGLLDGTLIPDDDTIQALHKGFVINHCDLNSFYSKIAPEFICKRPKEVIMAPKFNRSFNASDLSKIQKLLSPDSDYILIKNKDSVRIYSIEQD